MHGVDSGRLAMVLAVLERRARVQLYNRDVYVATVGGAKVADPSADLAAAIAVASAALNAQVSQPFVAIGEVGLAGELRRVPGTDRRLAEAARLGFTEAVVPAESRSPADRMTTMRHGLRIHSAATVVQALRALDLAASPGADSMTLAEPRPDPSAGGAVAAPLRLGQSDPSRRR
jgi:DNA repair protein RadA/Sms